MAEDSRFSLKLSALIFAKNIYFGLQFFDPKIENVSELVIFHQNFEA